MGKMNDLDIISAVAKFCKDYEIEIDYLEISLLQDSGRHNMDITIDLVNCRNLTVRNGELLYNGIVSDKFESFKYETIEQLIEKIKELI